MARKLTKLTDVWKIIQAAFSDDAQVERASESGLSWQPMGAAANAVKVGSSTPVMVFNSAGSIAYVAFGAAAMAAPSAPANGIPVPAGATIIVNSGDNEYVRASAATVFVYASEPEA